jgi:hypothetical protein
MVLPTVDVKTDRKQKALENEIIRIIRDNDNIDISGLVDKLTEINVDNSYFYKTALINLISSGQIGLTLDRKLIKT